MVVYNSAFFLYICKKNGIFLDQFVLAHLKSHPFPLNMSFKKNVCFWVYTSEYENYILLKKLKKKSPVHL